VLCGSPREVPGRAERNRCTDPATGRDDLGSSEVLIAALHKSWRPRQCPRLDVGSIAAVVAADRAVQRERRSAITCVVYTPPREHLHETVKRQGFDHRRADRTESVSLARALSLAVIW
jgi:hypothetical protein